jgi:hypothetical protein
MEKISGKSRLFASLIILFFVADSLPGQSFTEKKFINNSFKANKDITLEVSNKFGNISISPWSKDSIEVKVEIEGTATSLEKLHKIMEGIDVGFAETYSLIKAETEFNQTISMLFESFKGITDKLIQYDSKVQINFSINVPRYVNMRLSNRYGDITMENCTGILRVSLANGKFTANTIDKAQNIELSFSEAKINSISEGEINANFSEVSIRESGNMTLKSISSRYDLEKADRLYVDSKRDNYFIGSLSSINGTSYFTDFRISELGKQADLNIKFGSLRINMLNRTTDMIQLISGNSDIDLTFDPGLSFNLEIRHSNTFLVLPEKNSRVTKKSIDDNEFITSGTIGRNPGKLNVKIDARRGNVYIK